MSTPQTPPIDGQGATPGLTPSQQLEQMITQMEKDGVTLELIVAMVMSNPQGVGAMDICSDNIAGITDQSNVLSKVEADTIKINSILSKIESQLGGIGKSITQSQYDKSGVGSLLKSLQTAYDDLFHGNSSNPNGVSDLAMLQGLASQNQGLNPVITGLQAWEKDFQTPPSGQTFNFENDLEGWTPPQSGDGWGTPLVNDITWLAEQHYNANNQGGSSSGVDPLQTWWSDGNSAQGMASGQSQADTTEVQSLMQLLQGFDSTGQQMIQLASSQKSMMIKNEMAS